MRTAPIEQELSAAIQAVSVAPQNRPRVRWKSRKLAATPGYAGSEWNHGLMIIGRAVNGTVLEKEACWTVEEARERPDDYARKSLEPRRNCPLEWVLGVGTDYNANRSQFWGVTRRLLERLEGQDFREENWPSRLVWSNLCKIAPSKAGNPSCSLCEAQWDHMGPILLKEIETFRPRYIVFLTGLDWVRWIAEKADWLSPDPCGGSYLQATGRIDHNGGESVFAVATHPQRSGTILDDWSAEVGAALTVNC